MEPTFRDDQYLIVDELTYQFSGPKRGDVAVFRHPEPACDRHIESSYFNRVFFQGPCSNYIKRVIALPGEAITIGDGEISIRKKDGSEMDLREEYVPRNLPTFGNQTVVLDEDEYFVMGDNRHPNASSDSREWGALPKSHIVGKALVILLPPGDFGFVERASY